MIEKIFFHPAAEDEMNEAAAFYDSRMEGLGMSFLREVERATQKIVDHPELYPRVSRRVRRMMLRRFPYSVLYSVVGGVIYVLALASQKRRPFYWRTRN